MSGYTISAKAHRRWRRWQQPPESQGPPRGGYCANGARSPDATARARCLRVLLHHPHQTVHYRYEDTHKGKGQKSEPTDALAAHGHFGSFGASLRSFRLRRRPPARAALRIRLIGTEGSAETSRNAYSRVGYVVRLDVRDTNRSREDEIASARRSIDSVFPYSWPVRSYDARIIVSSLRLCRNEGTKTELPWRTTSSSASGGTTTRARSYKISTHSSKAGRWLTVPWPRKVDILRPTR